MAENEELKSLLKVKAAHQVEPEHITLNTRSSLWNLFFIEIIATNKDYQSKKEESSRKTSISALLTMPKPLSVWTTINCVKF